MAANSENQNHKSVHDVNLTIHDVLIKGNTKTKEYLIQADLEAIKKATNVQELLEAAGIANAKLQQLKVFDQVKITLYSGPPELSETVNVIVEVVEATKPVYGTATVYTNPATVEGSLNMKNLLGHADLWDGSLAYDPCKRSAEFSAGVFFPRLLGCFSTPTKVRVFLNSKDRMNFSSYKEQTLGLSLGLFSSKYHDLVYNLGWRTLTDPSQMASMSITSNLGHSLLSSLNYNFKIDTRDSPLRPTRGYSLVSSSQLCGLWPDARSLRFFRQMFDAQYAIPLGFSNGALNFGVSAGALFPWGRGFLSKPSSLPERFFLGGNFSPLCTVGGPTTLWGSNSVWGPTEPRRDSSFGRDTLGGDLSVSAFADLSFDLPGGWLKQHGVYGHVFAGVGNVEKLTDKEYYRNFSIPKFLQSFRSSVGVGLVIPTNMGISLECNYQYPLKQFEQDGGKAGFRFSVSA